MLTHYAIQQGRIKAVELQDLADCVNDLVWVDMLEPTAQEEDAVEKLLNIDVPTREEMREIELSNRLYIENQTLFATATLVTKAGTDDAETQEVTFVLHDKCLVTVRYIDPNPFRMFLSRVEKLDASAFEGRTVFVTLLELTVNRLADILEGIGRNIDAMTKEIFRTHPPEKGSDEKTDFQAVMRTIGINGDLVSKVHESLLSINRVTSFMQQTPQYKRGTDECARMVSIHRDLSPLSDYAAFLSGKLGFLLDATLGMIGIEQNTTIKLFSIAAVVFLPPTLIASIYGMNFEFMPELSWPFGYPFALGLMMLSAFLPYRYFKFRKWL